MTVSRSLSTLVRPHHCAALCEVCFFVPAPGRSAPLRPNQRYRTALPPAHRTLLCANEHPGEGRRLSPTWLHPQS